MGRRAKGTGSVYKEGNRWVAQIVTSSGKKIRRVRTTKIEATKALDSLCPNSETTLTQWIGDWLKLIRVKPNTLRRYVLIAKHVSKWGDVDLSDVTSRTVIEGLKHLGDWEKRKAWVLVKQALKFAVSMGTIKVNPLDGIPVPRIPDFKQRWWTENEAKKFLSTAVGSPFFGLFKLALLTGARLGELQSLTKDDVEPGLIIIRSGKTKSARRKINFEPFEFKLPLPKNNVKRALDKLCKKAGVPKIRFHDLRHTHASILLSKGGNPIAVAKRLGHSRPDLLLRVYGHVMPDDDKKLGEMLKW